ncbi:MAG: 2-phospho-L-lactate transferase [Xanthobacteraceae bacterium]|jgi:LPPG:FO 2-phospho-L-lactate transferase|nr:2-phospho-L-lactate transferase [Xanthobacteraceae bacterium]MBX3519567.1 2-phospho-L-lactate transferase [Xanthobacteraceae bacterium]MBX3549237.1 2-phospho-L-lactate transferase [Xanthobacteraceae bacterium]
MILALAGGVGGAKLANGLAQLLGPSELVIAVNTGDDFRHLGLHISPDLDSVMYCLAGVNNKETGWGLAGETWNFMEAMKRLGGPIWFKLGDGDLATHVERTRLLTAGKTLSAVTATLCERLGVAHRIVPMSDNNVATIVRSKDRWHSFQEYFVALKCEPAVMEIKFDGIEFAKPSPMLLATLESKELEGIVICPSNPFVSIDPILAIPGLRALIDQLKVPIVAVSPIIDGRAVKGPALKMMKEMSLEPNAIGVARYYWHLIDGFVLDETDSHLAREFETFRIRTVFADTIMKDTNDQKRVAGAALKLVADLRARE